MFSKTKENQRFVFRDDFGDELVAVAAVAAVAVAEVAADPDALIFPATTMKLSMLLFSLLLFSDKEVVWIVIFWDGIDVGHPFLVYSLSTVHLRKVDFAEE